LLIYKIIARPANGAPLSHVLKERIPNFKKGSADREISAKIKT
jgi:hypothetical protein